LGHGREGIRTARHRRSHQAGIGGPNSRANRPRGSVPEKLAPVGTSTATAFPGWRPNKVVPCSRRRHSGNIRHCRTQAIPLRSQGRPRKGSYVNLAPASLRRRHAAIQLQRERVCHTIRCGVRDGTPRASDNRNRCIRGSIPVSRSLGKTRKRPSLDTSREAVGTSRGLEPSILYRHEQQGLVIRSRSRFSK